MQHAVGPIASSRSSLAGATPSVASLWPRSPCRRVQHEVDAGRSGCWPIGVANVESSDGERPADGAELARSMRSRRGFDGLSAITSIVRPGRTASAKAPGCVPSTTVCSMPSRAHGPCTKAIVPA